MPQNISKWRVWFGMGLRAKIYEKMPGFPSNQYIINCQYPYNWPILVNHEYTEDL